MVHCASTEVPLITFDRFKTRTPDFIESSFLFHLTNLTIDQRYKVTIANMEIMEKGIFVNCFRNHVNTIEFFALNSIVLTPAFNARLIAAALCA